MNLASIDLNLLVAFEALMQEQHVTRAGQRIGLAQPSMSSALARLRVLFDDRLFVRTGQNMRPTPKALALSSPVSAALEQVRRALDASPKFEPKTARTCFTIAATDYGNHIVLPQIMSAVLREAPGVDVRVRLLTNQHEVGRQLEASEIDAFILHRLPVSPRTVRYRLFEDRYVWVRDASLCDDGQVLSWEEYNRLPKAWYVSAGSDGSTSTVSALPAEHGDVHRVAVMVPNSSALPFVVAGTDLIAPMSERIARRFAALAGVSVVALPQPGAAYIIDLVIARNRLNEAPLRWFVDLIRRETSNF